MQISGFGETNVADTSQAHAPRPVPCLHMACPCADSGVPNAVTTLDSASVVARSVSRCRRRRLTGLAAEAACSCAAVVPMLVVLGPLCVRGVLMCLVCVHAVLPTACVLHRVPTTDCQVALQRGGARGSSVAGEHPTTQQSATTTLQRSLCTALSPGGVTVSNSSALIHPHGK